MRTRTTLLLREIDRDPSATPEELATRLGLTPACVRRDLAALQPLPIIRVPTPQERAERVRVAEIAAQAREAIRLAAKSRRFVLRRTEDVSGVSGVGIVAEGCVFSDGTAVLRWTVTLRSTAVYASIEELEAIHGHNGATRVEWIDEKESK